MQWKYSRNKPSSLGEIVNSADISTYFTKRSGVYFYSISIVFLFYFPLRKIQFILKNHFLKRIWRKSNKFNQKCIPRVFWEKSEQGASKVSF